MVRTEAAKAVSSAWATTLASYEKELNPMDIIFMQQITSPAEVAKHVEDLDTN